MTNEKRRIKNTKRIRNHNIFFLSLSQTQFYRKKDTIQLITRKNHSSHMVLRGHEKKNLSQRYHVRLVDFLFIEAERFFFTSKCIWPMSFLLRKKSKFYGKLNISWKMCEDRLRNMLNRFWLRTNSCVIIWVRMFDQFVELEFERSEVNINCFFFFSRCRSAWNTHKSQWSI